MPLARRVPWWFVPSWILAALLVSVLTPVLSDLLWGTRPDRSVFYTLVYRFALRIFMPFVALVILIALEATLIARARLGIGARAWFFLGLLGTLSGLSMAAPLWLLVASVLALAGFHSPVMLLVVPTVASGVAAGSLIGVVQMTALTSARYIRAVEWVWARIAAAVFGALPVAAFVPPDVDPGWFFVAQLICAVLGGLVTGLALKRIVESQPSTPPEA